MLLTVAQTTEYYRQKAEESRAMAANSRSEQARATLTSIADQYEELARRAEERGDLHGPALS